MTEPLLVTKDVSRTFHVGAGIFRRTQVLTAVNSVSLDVHKGDVHALVGESGCGKSTLALMLLGLLEPHRGTILLKGQPVSEVPKLELARHVQPIFQDPYSSLNPRKTIGDIISLPLRVHDIGDAADRERRVHEMMDLVGLPKRYEANYPSQLSGGQRQRVAIARALIMRPELVICDEPTSALDVSVQSQILNLLMDLRKELGLTYILISHNLAVVEHIATEVAVMYLGRIVERKDTESLFRGAEHPYTHALLASVLTPEPGLGIPDAQLGIEFPNPINPPSGCAFHPRCPHATALCTEKAPRPIEHAGGMVECHIYDDAAPVSLRPEAA